MRIAYLAAGAAGMYCGSCLHDNTLAAALLARGEDVMLAPIYTPIRTDETDVSLPRVFLGGINSYLQQQSAFFRRLPQWAVGWLDRPGVLRLLAGRGASVDPAKLGDLTVSMLRGEEGNQSRQLDQLVEWLVGEARPDVVHLSNSMMLGLARRISERCGPPVVCALSGEDLFLDKLSSPHKEQARELLRERAREVHAFTALNEYYADHMAERLAVPRAKIEVIPHGLALDGHALAPRESPNTPRRIGFLSRFCTDKGIHLLVEAGELLAVRDDLPPWEIVAAGYLGGADRPLLEKLTRRAATGPLRGRFTYVGEPDRAGKIAFLQSLDVLCIPAVYRESKGLPVLEAWANGVPAVVPNHGAYPEMIAAGGGGWLHEPGDPRSVAQLLAHAILDPAGCRELGRRGVAAVRERFHADAMAEQTLKLYRRLTA
jgi:glycosyltransferase involved in cell wall biosynthesis